MKINYVCYWEKFKERSWSGTNFSLFKALEKNYCTQMVDCGYQLNIMEKILLKLNSISKSDNNELGFFNQFGYLHRIIPQVKISNRLNDLQNIVIQIGDIKKFESPYYIYQDLSIDALIKIKKENPEAFYYSGYSEINTKSFNRRNNFQKKIYENATGVFTMSEWLKNDLVNNSMLPEEKVHHVGAGYNIDTFMMEIVEKKCNKILFVGRDFERKGGEFLLEAFKILQRKYLSDAELYIAGPMKNPLDEEIENVHFLGDISKNSLSHYYNICDVFCMPSYFEAYGLVFIEALAFGLPCIGRNDFAMSEFITDGYNGYLVNNDDADILAIKMMDLLRNEEIKKNVEADHNYLNYSYHPKS